MKAVSGNPVALILHTESPGQNGLSSRFSPLTHHPVPLFCALSPRTLAKAEGTSGTRGWGEGAGPHKACVCGGTKVEKGGREQVCEEVYSTARGGGCC